MMAAQRAVVRMLFDPAFAAAVRRDPDSLLSELTPELRRQLAQLDDRALRQNPLRRRQTLRSLSEELKGATTLALAETGRVGFLDEFFGSAAFHDAVESRGHLTLAFAAWLTQAPMTKPQFHGVLALETALARARRETREPPQPGLADRAAGVIPVTVPRGALPALQACERYLFEVGLMPAVALCDDAPALELPPWDSAPVDFVTVPLDGNVTLVEIDAPLAALLRSLPAPVTQALRELAADEIVVLG